MKRNWKRSSAVATIAILSFFVVPAAVAAASELLTPVGRLRYEMRRKNSPAAMGKIAVVLPGTGGIRTRNFPFDDLIQDLTKSGYVVVIPSFEDVTGGTLLSSDLAFQKWTAALEALLSHVREGKSTPPVALVGYSLGASVALAQAATNPGISAVAEISGSLPDAYVERAVHLPPLLIVHNADDRVMPVFNADQLEKLCHLDKGICEAWRSPTGGHSFAGLQAVTVRRKILAFLETWCK